MTAKEILNNHLTKGSDTYLAGQEDNILKSMNEYALQIAEQAIENEKATYREGWYPPNLDRILSRIKKLTQ